MRKAVLSIISLLFFIWLIPLGVFIKPSQEKTACNGQRAICLCSHLLAKHMTKKGGPVIHNGGGAQKDSNGFGGTSHSFLSWKKQNVSQQQISFYHHRQPLFYSLLVVRSIEHVPKV